MTKIYLDHNIVHYFVRGFPKSYANGGSAEQAALAIAFEKHPELRFVISAWNVIESASERLPGAPAEELADRYADFYERLTPLHIPAHDVIEREEMKRCAYLELGLISTASEVPVFNEHLSQVLALSGIEPLLGYDIRKDLRYLARKPERREVFQEAKRKTLRAREELLEAKEQGRDQDPQNRRRILRAWFARLIPLRGPDNRVLSAADRERVLDRLTESPERVFDKSPAIRTENALTDIRANMGARKPRLQDAMDLMHAIVPLAYCDAFVSNDGNVREGAKRALQETRRPVIVAERLSEALDQLCSHAAA
jgi:hypothetical protein